MLYELHELVVQPSKHYYPLENVAQIFHQNFQQNRPPSHLVNRCHHDLTPYFFDKIFVRYTPLPSSKKGYATSASRNKHQQRNSQGPLCKILRITQARQFALIELFHPRLVKMYLPCAPLL